VPGGLVSGSVRVRVRGGVGVRPLQESSSGVTPSDKAARVHTALCSPTLRVNIHAG